MKSMQTRTSVSYQIMVTIDTAIKLKPVQQERSPDCTFRSPSSLSLLGPLSQLVTRQISFCLTSGFM